jgi:entericidin B
MMKKMIALVSLLGFALALVGCNTISGAGKDVEATGKGIDNAAKDVQKKL